jgi:hypothetical protein
VFATMRRKRRSTTMKSELGQGIEHFKRAASLAAQETSATVGPKYSAARDRVQPAAVKAKGAATTSWDSTIATLTPLIAAAAESMRQTGKETAEESKKTAKANKKTAKKLEKRANKAVGRQKSRRGGKLSTLVLAGAAVGAGAAFVLRRRKAAQWDEYDPSAPVTTAQPTGSAGDAAFEPSDPTGYATTTTGTTTTGTTTTGTTTAGTTTTGTTAGATAATDPVASADPALSGETTDSTLTTDPALTAGETDQTSSAQHSPTVARMASGKNKD